MLHAARGAACGFCLESPDVNGAELCSNRDKVFEHSPCMPKIPPIFIWQRNWVGMCISGKNTIRYSLRSIWIIFEIGQPRTPPRMHPSTSETLNIKSICLFKQLRHQHSSSKLYKRWPRQIGLHAPKTDRYLFILHYSLHDGENKKISIYKCIFTSIVSFCIKINCSYENVLCNYDFRRRLAEHSCWQYSVNVNFSFTNSFNNERKCS